MSGSRHPSPFPNSPPTNITLSPDSTTSRTYRLTETTSNISIEQHQQVSETPAASESTAPKPYAPQQVPQSSVKRSPSADPQEESSTMAMTKRQKRESPVLKQEGSQERMSPSSDSQDPESVQSSVKGKGVDRPQQDSAPVKKKRTRTLTTPHQAAVLHSLLAQSRFPTTAMREEVGRSIGLSARKVQIWFQNQRQKARRPRKEPDESTTLPPRYGPFPAFPPQAHSSSFSAMPRPSPPPNPQLLPTTYNAPVQQPYGRSQYPPEPSGGSQSVEPAGPLLGPGVPGADLYGSSYHGQSRGQREIVPSQDATTSIGAPYSSEASSQLYSPRINLQLPMYRPAANSGAAYDQNFNRTLPPLSFDTVRSASGSGSVSGGSQRHSPFLTLPPPEPSRPRQRSSLSPQVPHSISRTLDVSGHPRVILPPPFTLQPEPRWDESTTSACLRPDLFMRPRTEFQVILETSASPVSRLRGSVSPHHDSVTEERETPSESGPTLPISGTTSVSPIRGHGRYDPVRATFVPYAANVSSPAFPPSQTNRGDGTDDVPSPSRENP